ncbi:MAG: hypothetical protein RSP_21020 [Rhodanobacter sp.]
MCGTLRRLPRLAGMLWLLAMGGWSACALAQDAARPTGDYVLTQLDAAQQGLARQAKAHPDAALDAAVRQLGQMEDALRKQLGSAMNQPIEIMDGKVKGAAQRANAAALRTQAYLKAAGACRGGDAQALAASLALAVDQLAKAPASDKATAPVIDAVETPDQQPLFVVHPDDRPLAFVVRGASLLDPQCANPQLSLTDVQGQLLPMQPLITSITPQSIALKLASAAGLKPGGYVLHVVPQRKAFLVGCTKQPEAVATLLVALPLQLSVDYTLTASCRGQGTLTLGHGSLPAIMHRGGGASQVIDTAACANPESYTISATARLGGGDRTTVGPITQPADAGITAGLPGGLTLSWDPSVHTLFARSGAAVCPGVD